MIIDETGSSFVFWISITERANIANSDINS